MLITKSDFKVFQSCPECFWLYKKDRSKIPESKVTEFEKALAEQGDRVEEYARLLFPGGFLINERGQEGVEVTKEKMLSEKILFQAGFVADDLYSRCDVIQWNEELEAWDIYEIKASTSKVVIKADHYWDVAFQQEVLRRAQVTVGKLFLVELDSGYCRDGELDISQLFKVSDITAEVATMQEEIRTAIGVANMILANPLAPSSCTCNYKASSKHCLAFDNFHQGIPSYSIYDIARVSTSKLEDFISDGIVAMSDIPEDYVLTDIQYNQVLVNNTEFEIHDSLAIAADLAQLEYPLYFLDYETFPGAIPVFDKCYPYQQVPFQYSLHIMNEPNGDLIHHEYLHLGDGSPIPVLSQQLRNDIGDNGSVIVWNKSFEAKVNRDMATQMPDLEPFLLSLNERLYDLEDIFKKQYVVMKKFKGRTSIKMVLPALVPGLSYNGLMIQDGGAASNSWKRLYFGDLEHEESEQIRNDLLAYCELDTKAMVEILKYLRSRLD